MDNELVEAVAREWRCFHCGDVFTDELCARDHFGPTEDSQAACLIKAGAEGSLVHALREAEQEAANAWAAIHEEGTEAAQAYYRQTSRHRQQIQAAEELGYERGLADGRSEAATPLASLKAENEALRAALRGLVSAAQGLSSGTDWNNGSAARKYRARLLAAIPKARAALTKQGG